MSWFASFYRSAIGKKTVMAITGIILFGFVLVHMIGNLKLYLGAEHFNEYAEWLRAVGQPALPHGVALWIFRIVLLGAVILHLDSALKLTLLNRAARPVSYVKKEDPGSDYAARTMRWGGVLILLFVIYHLMHFTWGVRAVHPDFIPGEPYHNLVTGFSIWWVSVFYILANIALGFHLYHGLWSMFQSLGWNHPRFNSWRRNFAVAFAIIVTLGNVSFPISVMTGLVRPEQPRLEGSQQVSAHPHASSQETGR
jgi:succinate dehydrogenase / fumarate reductase cytochrome b subunit